MTRIRRIGIIAEDRTDFEAVKMLISRISNKDNLTFKPKIGNGSGKIRNKCLSWSNELAVKGCELVVLVHDLDRNNYVKLNDFLQRKLNQSTIDSKYICIPIEELEAWFLSDPEAIKIALNLDRAPRFTGLPETIVSPKEKLRGSVRHCSNNQVICLPSHNEKIAKVVSLAKMKEKCPTYRSFHEFVAQQRYA